MVLRWVLSMDCSECDTPRLRLPEETMCPANLLVTQWGNCRLVKWLEGARRHRASPLDCLAKCHNGIALTAASAGLLC